MPRVDVRYLVLIVVLVLFSLVGLRAYVSYRKTQEMVAQTSKQLRDTQNQLQAMASSTQAKFTNQADVLNQKNSQLKQLQADLKKQTTKQVVTKKSNSNSFILDKTARSVVKLVCMGDAAGDTLQIGSGVLYYSAQNTPANYFVETNHHVVATSDGSLSQCLIAVYPNYQNSYNYLLYKSNGYKSYKTGVDFAYLIPEVYSGVNGGTYSQLAAYAKKMTTRTYCSVTNVGDHVSILGYPGVGGDSLTVTDGIVSGYEYDSGIRYIKTSAKIEHGNSGGVAIEDSGCVVGIPTFTDQGSISSIGRILDLYNLFNV